MDYTVGELAKRSGLTVRALHHYEKLGLLPPSGRTQAGYRQYTEADVLTLHRILAYRQLGLPLKDIAPLLGADAPPLLDVLSRQLAAAQAQLKRQQRLVDMLTSVAARAQEAQTADLSDSLLTLMAMMRIYERYFTEDEMQQFAERRALLGDAGLRQTEVEWTGLIAAVRAEMAAGTDPLNPVVAALARRWMALAEQFTGEDQAIRSKVRAMYAHETDLQRETGVTPALLGYLRQSLLA
jgi:DNA-binding transcriptional MerR regulator